MGENVSGPDFICIGAQKAGTGWLYEQLRSHPDFWMPPLKEVHYFDRLGRDRPARGMETKDRIEAARKTSSDRRDLHFLEVMEELRAKPEVDMELYARLFEGKGRLISGDITPGYSTLVEEIVRQIMVSFPGLKIVFIARDPVERAWSQLSMWVRHGVIDSFDETSTESIARHLESPGVMARSYPSRIIRRWRQFVRPDALGIYFFDDLQRDPTKVRSDIISFLGGDPAKASGALAAGHNPKATKQKLSLNDDVRTQLATFFKDELKASAAELGGPASQWPARYGF
jgi:hypothetical protein